MGRSLQHHIYTMLMRDQQEQLLTELLLFFYKVMVSLLFLLSLPVTTGIFNLHHQSSPIPWIISALLAGRAVLAALVLIASVLWTTSRPQPDADSGPAAAEHWPVSLELFVDLGLINLGLSPNHLRLPKLNLFLFLKAGLTPPPLLFRSTCKSVKAGQQRRPLCSARPWEEELSGFLRRGRLLRHTWETTSPLRQQLWNLINSSQLSYEKDNRSLWDCELVFSSSQPFVCVTDHS